SDLKYTKEHEWLRKSGGNKYTLGITDKAQKDLGEIVYVESPEVGTSFEAEEAIGSIESVKAVAEIFIPVAAKITAINESLSDEPEQLNNDPYGDGWLVEVEVANEADVQSLLTKDQYEAFLKEDE
ncbi:glycine cleavage system protein H, partial [Mariannaea sp. PMI_226]